MCYTVAMVTELIPNWVKEREQKDAEDELTAKNKAMEELFAQMKIDVRAPAFWKSVLKELHFVAQGLSRVRATLSSPVESKTESTCRLEVITKSLCPKLNYVDLFFRNGSRFIRCNPYIGKSYCLDFCMDGDSVAVCESAGYRLMNPETAAQFIAEEILDSVK